MSFFTNRINYSQAAVKLKSKEQGRLIISCKRKEYNFYSGMTYNKFDNVLTSKGWTHNKSKGDHFTILPNLEQVYEETKPFNNIGVHPNIVDVLTNQGISNATLFQCQAISVINSESHTLLAAETGCGKTISYLIPIVQKLSAMKQDLLNTPKALILAPSRELAKQIGSVASSLAEPFDLKVKVLVGGSTKRLMMNPEMSDIDILIGTPGVVGKLSTIGLYRLGEVQHTVLDEADTLLDDSFIDRMQTLLNRTCKSQLILVTATIPKRLPDYLKPFETTLTQVMSPRIHRPLLNITQKFIRLTRTARPAELLEIAKNAKQPLMVFTNKNNACDWLAMFLRDNGLKCANINGNMNHAIRINQWNDFVSGNVNILSATDIASRGLDTKLVSHVVNYDFPLYMADYIHRIGRTGRFGSPESCKVTNFICSIDDVKLVQEIEVRELFCERQMYNWFTM